MSTGERDMQWRLVPTEEMVAAGLENYAEGGCVGLSEEERREAVYSILEAALAAAPQPAPAGEPVARVKPLVWEDITEARSDEDPTRELTGDYEAVTPVGTYYIEMYFGTDSYGWDVSFNGDYIADRDDPDEAKAVALAHFNQVILSTLEPTPPTVDTDAVRRAALEEAAKFTRRWLEDWGYDLQETRDQYIDAQTSGVMAGRKITKEMAKTFARNFAERADAVYDCGALLESAIRALAPQPAPPADGGK